MFRDEKQTHSAIRALLATLPGLGRLWTDTGPTDEAARTLEGGGPAMSTGEALLVRVAFDLWNKGGNAPLGHVINTLGNAPLAALGGLLVALTQRPEALDAWINTTRTAGDLAASASGRRPDGTSNGDRTGDR